jgi:hypothetical protein
MEPAVHRLTVLRPQPASVWERLESEIAAGGSPPISIERTDTTVTFVADTGESMLRARVADALMSACAHGEWRRSFAPED